MSPALDMPLNRREAMTSLLAMLAFVMGVGGLPDDSSAGALAGSPLSAADLRANAGYNIAGTMVAHDAYLEILATIRIEDACISIQHVGSNKVRTIHAQKPAAIALVDTLAVELRSGGKRTNADR